MFFNIKEPIPYMNQVVEVNSKHRLPSITHVDNTARVQTVNKNCVYRIALLLKIKHLMARLVCRTDMSDGSKCNTKPKYDIHSLDYH